MGVKHSKQSVDISSTPKKPGAPVEEINGKTVEKTEKVEEITKKRDISLLDCINTNDGQKKRAEKENLIEPTKITQNNKSPAECNQPGQFVKCNGEAEKSIKELHRRLETLEELAKKYSQRSHLLQPNRRIQTNNPMTTFDKSQV